MNGLSLFASAGIGETYLSDLGINILVANELIQKRADLYKALSPNTKVICGDITKKEIIEEVINSAQGIDFLIASPPCQGMSIAGKNRCEVTMLEDQRNYLITYVVEILKALNPKYVLIENVPALLKLRLFYGEKLRTIEEILEYEFGMKYCITSKIIDSSDCGVPQTRLRAIIKMYPKDSVWPWPEPIEHKITVRDAIAHLPSLESGESSNIKWHFARNHDPRHILWMRNTPTGQSAYANPVYYPQHADARRIKGYESSYRRIKWDEPSPTITIRNDAISSQRNVHPGRVKEDGTYSDARVLTPLEIMILNSLPADWPIPDNTPEILIRQVIGESIPPLMIKKIVGELPCMKR